MAAETGFLIDGTVYEVPSLFSLELAELEVLYERSGFGIEDFIQTADEGDDDYDVRLDKMVRRPGVMRALMEVAYQRGNPTVKRDKVAELIGRTNYLDAVSTMSSSREDEEPEEDAVPLGLTTPLDERSQSGSSESTSLSEPSSDTLGNDSPSGSGEQDDPLASIGTSKSLTSPISAQEISAA